MEILDNIEETILDLEKELLIEKTRSLADKIAEILDDSFIEYCSSGKIYKYKKGDIFFNNMKEIQILDFKIKEISEGTYLANYIAKKIYNNKFQNSLRSSIWKIIDNNIKLVFHQGTNIPE